MGGQEDPALCRASVGAIVVPDIVLRFVFEKRVGRRKSGPFPMHSYSICPDSSANNQNVGAWAINGATWMGTAMNSGR